jgi:tRNA modification GTPase
MAQPGEYTMRAYLNGKLDLSQAEAVADLIASTNQATHRMAMSQLRGHFSSELKTLRDQLLQLTSLLELELDFSDHEELEFADRDELQQLARHIDLRIQQLAKSFERGQALKAGIPVAIIGRTNVGKSTLLNQLVGDDRAIVSDIHGTTRDTIEEAIDINGIQFRFIDTAGIRNTTDTIEQIGIARTYAAIEKASIVLWLTDKAPSPSEVSDITQRCKDKSLIILHNKIDLERDGSLHASEEVTSDMHLYISAKTGLGIPALRQAIYTAANIPSFTENDVIVTNARHYDSLIRAHESILPVIEGLQNNLSSDLLSEDLRQTLSILSEITGGQITPQETLNNIFQHFCVGK